MNAHEMKSLLVMQFPAYHSSSVVPNLFAKLRPTSKTLACLYLGQDSAPHGSLLWWKCSSLNLKCWLPSTGPFVNKSWGRCWLSQAFVWQSCFWYSSEKPKPSWKGKIQKYIVTFSKIDLWEFKSWMDVEFFKWNFCVYWDDNTFFSFSLLIQKITWYIFNIKLILHLTDESYSYMIHNHT